MALLARTKKEVGSDKNSENVPKLESVKCLQYNVISWIMIINIYEKFYLVLFRMNNLDN